jgi:hypothetical protein
MKSASTLLVAATFAVTAAAAEPAVDGESFYKEQVLPLLQKRCLECHSHAGDIEGGLTLDSRSGWEQGGDTGPALVPGKPDESLLIKAVRYADPELQMPPDGRLSPPEVAVLERWIAGGAAAPADDTVITRPKPSIDVATGKNHWAFRPVVAAAPPAVRDTSWPREDVDRFLLARLEAEGLRPTADADRHAWLRRVSFDVTGLPPTPAEIAAYMADTSANADAAVVDRLLTSRSFGERWARHWLDLTGYADQMGTSNNVFSQHAWRYRDYLIDSFNADKPYDRFVLEQIAGDLLPDTDPPVRAANRVATGFLVLGDVEIVNVDKMKLDWDIADQQITKVGTAFLGMTLGCVRCHDHKFDPISLEDYYGLAGIFLSTKSVHKIPIGVWSKVNEVELPETDRQVAARLVAEQKYRERVADLKAQRDRLQARHKEIAGHLASMVASTTPDTKTPSVKSQLPAEQAAQRLRGELQKEYDRIKSEIGSLNGTITHAEFFAPKPPRAHGVHDAEKPLDATIAIRGNPRAAGAVVPRGVLRVASWSHAPPMPPDHSGRLQLAEWIADPLNPLTARVAVNRIWQKLFGSGLVRSVDYFGIRGDTPTHPELLDRLAADFVRAGWSQKRLIRRLVLSRAYRMGTAHDATAAAKDPDNLLLWRMNRRRLDAEAIRDGILLVSGRLIESTGGPSLPLEYQENTGGLTGNVNPPAFALRKFRVEQEFERTVYLPIVRARPQAGPARLREVFDFTQPATFAGMRSQTVVPTQSLYLLNDSLLRARAADTARLVLAAATDRDRRLEQLWLRVLNRPITPAEIGTAAGFLDRLPSLLAGSKQPEEDAWTELCHGILSTNEFLHEL